ncbi:MAG: manganese efflux pump [Betaproteobacteria bacterium]|nr:manganese efflux pump [Betaproteobacteria bacterium]
MDAVAVAIVSGIAVRHPTWGQTLRMSLTFGAFQAFMPWIGFLAGRAFAGAIDAWDHWLAFGVLAFIGAKMIHDARHAGEGAGTAPFSATTLFTLGVATSLDALAVGLSFSLLEFDLVPTVATIGLVTLGLCIAAVRLGARLGRRAAQRADIVGGVILIAIGAKILVEHLVTGT